MRRVLCAVIAAISVLASGCASLSNNVTQPVIVTTSCGEVPIQGAQCRIINARGTYSVQSTPASVMIRRAPSDLAIDCRIPNQVGQTMPILSESYANRAAWGNLLGPLMAGWAYDAWQDAAWRYESTFNVDLCRDVPPGVVKSIQTSASEQSSVPQSPLANMQSVTSGQQKYAYTAETIARQQRCSSTPRAVLNARGPATEVYTVPCNNGNTLMLRCTWGECKAI